MRRLEVARALRAIIGFRAIRIVASPLLLRAVEVHALDFADAYLVASAERTGVGVVGVVVSFDRGIDRGTAGRHGPA